MSYFLSYLYFSWTVDYFNFFISSSLVKIQLWRKFSISTVMWRHDKKERPCLINKWFSYTIRTHLFANHLQIRVKIVYKSSLNNVSLSYRMETCLISLDAVVDSISNNSLEMYILWNSFFLFFVTDSILLSGDWCRIWCNKTQQSICPVVFSRFAIVCWCFLCYSPRFQTQIKIYVSVSWFMRCLI